MNKHRIFLVAVILLAASAVQLIAQPEPLSTPEQIARRNAVEAELQSVANVATRCTIPRSIRRS